MEVWLIRHEQAEAEDARGDAARALSPAGRKRARATAERCARHGLEFDRLLHSPLLRALETAEAWRALARGGTQVSPELCAPPDERLLLALRELALPRVALVGHEPWLSELAGLLCAGAGRRTPLIELDKGALACLAGEPAPGGMRLVRLVSADWLR